MILRVISLLDFLFAQQAEWIAKVSAGSQILA